ncbi:deoxynucleoside monophosphate kinase [Streptomyces phage Vash]|uniref:Deoxynucleoside monophosphate kinase n=1 Tax=Streptomyces phage Vash TaxID=2510568 RepID=A0A411AYZ2_9CAUD|nr:deoxynucleoside monophosphate kinase [Streptomyces phage Vash]QAX93277.1 deoxynucleoside monophosphate kinase [Streptomyces phage Vash]
MAYYKSIGLIGRAQSGKDTVGARLRKRYGYQRVAFADPLKAAALRIDPVIPTTYGVTVRLSTLVNSVGWDYAKVTYPEVRRVLQHVGQTVRDIDPEFWVRAAAPAIDAAERLGLPVVVTDTRYENEARYLRDRGFSMVRVTRPGAGATGETAKHKSETELENWAAALTIANTGTLDDLNRIVDSLLLPRSR